MGPCASSQQPTTRNKIPLMFQSALAKQHPNCQIQHEFQFQLYNIKVLSILHANLNLTFTLKDVISIQTHKNNLTFKETIIKTSKNVGQKQYEMQWNQMNKININSTISQLSKKHLQIYLSQQDSEIQQIIRIQLSQICFGAYHHNIEIPYRKTKLRVIFDCKMSHIFESSIKIQQLKILTNHTQNIKSSYFTVRAFHDENLIIQSNPSYQFNLDPKHSTSGENDSFFQKEMPNINKLKHKSNVNISNKGDQTDTQMFWKCEENKAMPSITLDISAQEISYYYLQIMVWSIGQGTEDSYLYQAKVPLWKALQKESVRRQVDAEFADNKNKLWIQERRSSISQKLFIHHNSIGHCQLKISIKNEKMIKQSKYEVRTQNGLVYINSFSPSILSQSDDVKSNNTVIDNTLKIIKEIDEIIKKPDRNKTFQKETNLIGEKLIKINDTLIAKRGSISYNDGQKDFQMLINNQQILLAILQKLVIFVENNDNQILSKLSWNIILNIFQRQQFSLENLCLKGIYTTPAGIDKLNKKKQIGRKYQVLMNHFIYYALKGYGFSHELNQVNLNFFSFCFFRVPIFRESFFQEVQIQGRNHEVEKRLMEYHQHEIEPLSSHSSNYEKIKTNWSGMFYDILKNEQQFKKSQRQLLKNCKNKRWFMEISYKEQLFYQFINLILEQLPVMNVGGHEKWKYIDGYIGLVMIIMSELKNSSIDNYSQGLAKASVSLLFNENLINLVIPFISENINVYDFEKVCIFLDLLNEYLKFLTQDKSLTLKSNFNQNYFFSFVKTIFEGEHFYSINRILIIIFDYFDCFTEHGRYQLSMYLLGHTFFKLFYHWSKDIRYTFYNILLIKIKYIKHRKEVEIVQKLQKAIDLIKAIQQIYNGSLAGYNKVQEDNVYKRLKAKVDDKMKNKLSKRISFSSTDYSIKNLLKKVNEDYQLPMTQTVQCFQRHELAYLTPGKKKRSFSQNYLKQDIKIYGSPTFGEHQSIDETPEHLINIKSDQTSSKGGRRKRKPSIFLSSQQQKSSQVPKVSNDLYYFNELTNEEIKNIEKGKHQFNQIRKEIITYFQIYGKAPNKKLDEHQKKIKAN